MFCIQCGKKIGDGDRFCCFCGARTPCHEEPERLLQTFGPFGFTIGKGAAGLFSWEYRNLTRFEITTKRFRTVHQSSLPFSVRRTMELDIPVEAIVSTERYTRPYIAFGLMGVLGIKYHSRNGVEEINITGDNGTLDRANTLLCSLVHRH